MIAAAGKQAYVGSDVEMGLGTLALGHFAAASPECDARAWPCDLRGPLLLIDDVLTAPPRYEDGRLLLPLGPGLHPGRAVDADTTFHPAPFRSRRIARP